MGWKRFEKELQKAGKSVENEGRRVADRAREELARLANIKSESASSTASVEPPVVQQPVPSSSIEVQDTITEEKNVNPEFLQPGRAYIINHLTFENTKLKQRTGSEGDVYRLRKIFRQFGMKVKRIQDATLGDVRAVMKKIASIDFESLSCLVIVIMSHGHESNIIAAKDGEYSLDHDIMYPILTNRSLTSKLKLLVTQACKGPVNPLLEIEGPCVRPSVIPSEILQISSCVEGYVSYLDSKRGGIFIEKFCDHLEESGLKKDIIDIANAVVADVKTSYYDIQIPMVHTNLTKKFVFGHYVNPTLAIGDIDDSLSEEESTAD